METSSIQSILEMLPDEILLEMCKYLLCSDILHSFIGLNYRMTQMITQYRQHVSLHKTSITKFDYLCVNIFPQIGSHIRSLVLDCCYSVLEDQLFIKHFNEKMSMTFPNLERISLVSFQHEQIVTFLSTLNDLNYLTEIYLYSLFPIQRIHQPTFAQSLIQANNHRFTTIFMDDQSSSLSFNDTDRYLNILRLRIKLTTIADLPSLFLAFPNVQDLDVIVENRDHTFVDLDTMKLSPLLHLTNFRLKSVIRIWILGELLTLLVQLPIVRTLSLFLSTDDKRLVSGDIILPSVPTTVQQFNYAVYFISDTTHDKGDTFISSWPSSYPVACYFNNEYFFFHTLPWHLTRMEFFSFFGEITSCQTNIATAYDRQVEQLYLKTDKDFTFSKSLVVLSQCRRVRELLINIKDDGDAAKEEQPAVSCLPKLSRLNQICFYGSTLSHLNHFSLILNAASNLCRLDLSFSLLMRLIEDPQICCTLGQRITSLCIFENDRNSSSVTLKEEHIPIIGSVLFRVRDIYVNAMHLPCTTTIVSSEDILEGSFLQTPFDQSGQQTHEVISPFSSESMLVCLLTKLKEHRLLAVCIDGLFVEKIKTDPEQWLQSNTILCEQQFKAAFHTELNRLLIWM